MQFIHLTTMEIILCLEIKSVLVSMVFLVNNNDTNRWCGRLIVSALVSGTGDLGSSPGRGRYDGHFTLTVPFS